MAGVSESILSPEVERRFLEWLESLGDNLYKHETFINYNSKLLKKLSRNGDEDQLRILEASMGKERLYVPIYARTHMDHIQYGAGDFQRDYFAQKSRVDSEWERNGGPDMSWVAEKHADDRIKGKTKKK